MKSVILFSAVVAGVCLMSFSPLETPVPVSSYQTAANGVQWKNESVDLGDIPQGKPVTIYFEFTNTGKSPVIVSNVQAGCGCTVTDYPKSPVAAGKTEKITATFNAAVMGAFSKTVTVNIENESPKVLNFKGTVI